MELNEENRNIIHHLLGQHIAHTTASEDAVTNFKFLTIEFNFSLSLSCVCHTKDHLRCHIFRPQCICQRLETLSDLEMMQVSFEVLLSTSLWTRSFALRACKCCSQLLIHFKIGFFFILSPFYFSLESWAAAKIILFSFLLRMLPLRSFVRLREQSRSSSGSHFLCSE